MPLYFPAPVTSIIQMVHSFLSVLGWVSGGPVAVVQALMGVVTEKGTLVIPTHSGDYSTPEHWRNPPVFPRMGTNKGDNASV